MWAKLWPICESSFHERWIPKFWVVISGYFSRVYPALVTENNLLSLFLTSFGKPNNALWLMMEKEGHRLQAKFLSSTKFAIKPEQMILNLAASSCLLEYVCPDKPDILIPKHGAFIADFNDFLENPVLSSNHKPVLKAMLYSMSEVWDMQEENDYMIFENLRIAEPRGTMVDLSRGFSNFYWNLRFNKGLDHYKANKRVAEKMRDSLCLAVRSMMGAAAKKEVPRLLYVPENKIWPIIFLYSFSILLALHTA